jgi:phosphopantetheinyl transferase
MRVMDREVLLLVNSRELQNTGSSQAPVFEDDLISAARHHRPLRRQQFLAARALLRTGLEAATGVAAARWQITTDANGRPAAIGPGDDAPDVSLSHSGNRVATAIAWRGRVGIDIEMAREGRSADALAEAVLSPAERAVVARDGQAAFLRFWTLREAIGKANGGGFDTALSADGARLIGVGEVPAVVDLDGVSYALAQRALDGGSLAVAWMLTDEICDPLVHVAAALADERLAITGC